MEQSTPVREEGERESKLKSNAHVHIAYRCTYYAIQHMVLPMGTCTCMYQLLYIHTCTCILTCVSIFTLTPVTFTAAHAIAGAVIGAGWQLAHVTPPPLTTLTPPILTAHTTPRAVLRTRVIHPVTEEGRRGGEEGRGRRRGEWRGERRGERRDTA